MAARTTRQSLTDLRESIKNDKKDIVVIPADLFISLLNNHAEAQDKFTEVTKKVNETMKQLSAHTEKASVALDRIANSQEEFQHSLFEKLDNCHRQSKPMAHRLVLRRKINLKSMRKNERKSFQRLSELKNYPGTIRSY